MDFNIDSKILETFKIKAINTVAESTMAPKFYIYYEDDSKPTKVINSYLEFEDYKKDLIEKFNLIVDRNNKLDKI